MGAGAAAALLASPTLLLAQSTETPPPDVQTAPELELRPGVDAVPATPQPETTEAPPAVTAPAPAAQDAAEDAAPATTAPAAALPAEPEDPAAELAEVEAALSMSKERAAELKREIEQMQGDRARQNAALIAAAERVKLAEADIVKMEDRLGELIVQELEVRGRLDGADQSISSVLAALERISRNPPPALIVNPSDALGSARSAILISAILPALRDKADAVMSDLNQLTEIKQAALAEQEKLEANFEILEEEQLRIATLIAARKQNETRVSADLEAEEAEANALAAKAGSLKELVDELTRRADAVSSAADATARANSGEDAPRLSAETIELALANTERTEQAIPFDQAKGYLLRPSSGVTVIEYGASDGFGGISKGLSVVTRADAQVVAPADGRVLYKGPFLNYGQIVILNTGQGYTMLLAGLERIDVDLGQFVMMGEPIGAMGSRTIGRTVATNAGVSRPTLYIEMRKNDAPVDPTGWWASAPNPSQSG